MTDENKRGVLGKGGKGKHKEGHSHFFSIPKPRIPYRSLDVYWWDCASQLLQTQSSSQHTVPTIITPDHHLSPYPTSEQPLFTPALSPPTVSPRHRLPFLKSVHTRL